MYQKFDFFTKIVGPPKRVYLRQTSCRIRTGPGRNYQGHPYRLARLSYRRHNEQFRRCNPRRTYWMHSGHIPSKSDRQVKVIRKKLGLSESQRKF